MLRYFSLFIVVLMCSGCGMTYKPTVPLDYVGETATVVDTYNRTGGGSAHFFIVTSLNSNAVYHSLQSSAGRSQGQGNSLTLLGQHRDVPAQAMKLNIVGLSYYAAPIVGMFASDGDHSVRGEIEFTPKANQTYLVTGEINKETSAVWVEDMFGNIVTEKLTVNNESEVTELIKLSEQEQQPLIESLSREAFFHNIKPGEPVEFVVSKIGEADKVEVEERGFFSVKQSAVIYTYDGLGKIYFSEYKDKALHVLRTTKG